MDKDIGKGTYDRRAFFKAAGLLLGSSLAAGVPAVVKGAWIDVFRMELVSVDLVLPRLSANFEGFRILQLSDIHFDQYMLDRTILRLIKGINALRPDVVVITGDFMAGTSPFHFLSLSAALTRIHSGIRKLAILGNHDHFVNPYAVKGMLRAAEFLVLQNAAFIVERKGSRLIFCGLDDPLWKKADLSAFDDALTGGGAAILLVHEPDFVDQISQPSPYDLALAGHTHGGQVRHPILGPLFRPELGRKYTAGLYSVGNMLLYVNRGLGQVGPRFRLNAPPELTLFHLHASPHPM
jgi:hypothetical protein